MVKNQFGQVIGEPLPDFQAGQAPDFERLEGRYTIIEPLSLDKHAQDLYAVYGPETPESMWTYLPIERCESAEVVDTLIQYFLDLPDAFYAIIDKATRKAVGTFSLMRLDKANRCVEVGWVIYSPALKQTRMATEAQYLLAKYVFEDMGYRRYEWKCDSLNQASRRAAERLGFSYEGTFRQAAVYKGRSRDTNWLSLLDKEWPQAKARLEKWLAPENFDAQGRQIKRLEDC